VAGSQCGRYGPGNEGREGPRVRSPVARRSRISDEIYADHQRSTFVPKTQRVKAHTRGAGKSIRVVCT